MRSARSSAGVRGTVRGRDSIGYSGLLPALWSNAAGFREVPSAGRILSKAKGNPPEHSAFARRIIRPGISGWLRTSVDYSPKRSQDAHLNHFGRRKIRGFKGIRLGMVGLQVPQQTRPFKFHFDGLPVLPSGRVARAEAVCTSIEIQMGRSD